MSDNVDMPAILAAVALLQGGERVAGRVELFRIWQLSDASTPPVQRCSLAHFLADTETDPVDELEWDLLALEAATGARTAIDIDALDAELASFLPSLHLNAGDAYRRVGDMARARLHAAIGLKRAAALPDDPYSNTVRTGLARLAARSAEEPTAPGTQRPST
ncbi:MAG: hypothetical protein ABIS14_09720 [Sphingomonas sp.]